ncbi:hypothetical protein LBMAG47_02060 [Planctomycetia bacterium]|nr:hypothetical protein LBMAG47_02060 [Planctomycetia bacterium]
MFPFRQQRDGFPQPVIRREYSVIAMPVLPRRRHEIGEPVELAFRRQGHPWPLPPWAVAAKAKVWLDRRTGILSANGESSTTPLAPGRVDLRARPGPTQLAALCPGSAWRMRAIRPSGPRITESRPSALSPQPQSAASDVHGLRG